MTQEVARWWRRAAGHRRCRPLGPPDARRVEGALRRDPIATVTLRSEIALGALDQGRLVGVEQGPAGLVCAAVLTSPLVVPWIPDLADLPAVADWLRPSATRIHLMVGSRETTFALDRALRDRLPPPRLLRRDQPQYVLDPSHLTRLPGPPAPVRRARPQELPALVRAGAAMHLEEVGFDPLAVDPHGFRRRLLTLVDRGWAWVWTDADGIVFKAECAAVTPEAIQLQGVWVAPERRGRGLGTRGVAAVCAELLEGATERVTLFVNAFNTRAIRVYERIGFAPAGTISSYLY